MTDRKRTDNKREAGIADYVKEAFLFRWNLLFFLGGAAAAVLSPIPDVLLPLLGAAELAYLAGLSAIPRFRAAIDAKVHAEGKQALVKSGPPTTAQAALQDILGTLEPDARNRFQRLRDRCLEMRKIAQGVRGSAPGDRAESDELRTPALDRLLWVFLRLLRSRQALQRFLATTDEKAIEKRLADLEQRKETAGQRGDDRIVRSLVDNIATTQLRLDNYRKAESNAEFVTVELDRIEGKIQALTEVMISTQDPDFISSQVDSVAESMKHTEEAIAELNSITGLRDEMEGTPAILEASIPPALEVQ